MIVIQLEVHGSETSRVPRIRKIFDFGGNHPAVKACWNSNQTDLLDGGFEANFKLLKDQIGQVHMRDLYLEEYPWRALITILAAMNSRATASPRSRSPPTASGSCSISAACSGRIRG